MGVKWMPKFSTFKSQRNLLRKKEFQLNMLLFFKGVLKTTEIFLLVSEIFWEIHEGAIFIPWGILSLKIFPIRTVEQISNMGPVLSNSDSTLFDYIFSDKNIVKL